MNLVYQADHVGDGLGKLLAQFQGKPRMEAVLSAFMRQIQQVEEMWFDLYLLTWLDTAEDINLDVIGATVGEPRLGSVDLEYRAFIRARVKVNRSTGLLSELVTIVQLIQNDGQVVYAQEFYPAAIRIEPSSAVVVNALRVARMLLKAKTAGVALRFVFSKVPRANTFLFDNGADPGQVTADQTFGDGRDDPVGGGKLSGVFG